jgi:hypothetical protein
MADFDDHNSPPLIGILCDSDCDGPTWSLKRRLYT